MRAISLILVSSMLCLASPALAQKGGSGSKSEQRCTIAPDVGKAKADGAAIDVAPHPVREALFGGKIACREELISIYRGDDRVFTATYEYGTVEGVSFVVARQRDQYGDIVKIYLGPDAVPNFANPGNVVLGLESARCFKPKDRSKPFSCSVEWGGESTTRTVSEVMPGRPSVVSIQNGATSDLGIGRSGMITVAGNTVEIPFGPSEHPLYAYEGRLTGPQAASVTNAALQEGRATVMYVDPVLGEVEAELDLAEMRLATAMVRRIGPVMLASGN